MSLVSNDLKITTAGLPEGEVTMTIASGMIKNTGDGVNFTGDTLSDSVSITFTVQPKAADVLDVFKPFAAAHRFVLPTGENTVKFDDAVGAEIMQMLQEDLGDLMTTLDANIYDTYGGLVDPEGIEISGHTGGIRMYAIGVVGNDPTYDLETMIPFRGSEQVLGNLVDFSLVASTIADWSLDSMGTIFLGTKAASNVEFVIIYDRITINY